MRKKVTKSMIGKSGELFIASFLLKNEIEVYLPLVDTGIDLLTLHNGNLVQIQVKSFKAYTQILGVSQDWLKKLSGKYFLVIIYRMENNFDVLLVLSKEQTMERTVPTIKGGWNDVKISKKDREDFKDQNLDWLVKQIKTNNI